MFGILASMIAIALVSIIGVMTAALPVDALWFTGGVAYVSGLLLGLPASALYNFFLYRSLARQGGVPRDFVWRPFRHHARLPSHERRAILPWFAVCAFGFALTMLGSTLCMLGLLRV